MIVGVSEGCEKILSETAGREQTRPLDKNEIVPRRLIQFVQNTLHILSDVSGLRQRCRVRHGERNVDQSRQRLCQQRLATPRRPEDQDV